MISLDRLMGKSPKPVHRGQILVVVALVMVGLLATAGLATDVGIILMRKAQFDRAVDGAALAGAPKVGQPLPDGGLAVANKRGMEIIFANGIVLANKTPGACPLAAGDSYCGEKKPGNLPGSTDYHVEARWNVDLAFMSVLRLYSISLVSTAEASYYDNVDVFTSGNDQGVLQNANMELFGPKSCAANGDAFSPTDHWRNEPAPNSNPYYNLIDPPGVYTYRIAVPESFLDDHNLVRVELYDPQTGNLKPSNTQNGMNLAGSPDYPGGDPQTYYPTTVENLNPSLVPITGTNSCGSTSRQDPCLHGRDSGTTGAISNDNPFWYVRMDENRAPCFNYPGYVQSNNTKTWFTLYYYKQESSGELTRVNLARYTGMADDGATTDWYKTALMWVSPGAPASERMPQFDCKDVGGSLADCTGTPPMVGSPAEPATTVDTCPPTPAPENTPCTGNSDFIVNLNPNDDINSQPANETPNIYQDPTTKVRYLYLDVQSRTGSSENNWALWAGPALSEDASVRAPAFINARQTYIYKQSALDNTVHASSGVVTYGVGHLPMNSDSKVRTKFPLASIGPELAGAPMKIRLFDADADATPPVIFYYDTIPQSDWSMCWGTNAAQCSTFGSPKSWQYQGTTPDTFGNICYTAHGTSCGEWTYLDFDNPTDANPNPPADSPAVPFYGGRLMVSYQAGGQDTFGWWITVGARPSLVN